MNLRVRSVHGHEFTPKKHGDVGHDLFVRIYKHQQSWLERWMSTVMQRRVLIIWPIVGMRTLHSGVHLVLPDDIWCEIRPRSSTSTRKLQILGGTIDSGYRGELFTVLHNFGLMPKLVFEGERYSQAVFFHAVRPSVEYIEGTTFHMTIRAEELANINARTTTGFGSTGK